MLAARSASTSAIRSREVERAGDAVDVVGGRARGADDELAQRVGSTPACDLEAHGVAALAPPQLLLDRLQQVLGLLLVDLEVGVARDAERADRSTISLPGKSSPTCGAITSSRARSAFAAGAAAAARGAAAAAGTCTTPSRGSRLALARGREHHARLRLRCARCGNGCAGSIASGVSAGRLVAEVRSRARRAASASSSLGASTTMPRSASARQDLVRQSSVQLARRCACARSRDPASCSRGREARPRGADVALRELLLQPGDAHHEELVEVRRDDGRNLSRSSSGVVGSRPPRARAR